jgi:hypothetical protein
VDGHASGGNADGVLPEEELRHPRVRAKPSPDGRFLRFLLVAGPRKGQVLGTLAEQFTPATGTVAWTDEDTKQALPQGTGNRSHGTSSKGRGSGPVARRSSG